MYGVGQTWPGAWSAGSCQSGEHTRRVLPVRGQWPVPLAVLRSLAPYCPCRWRRHRRWHWPGDISGRGLGGLCKAAAVRCGAHAERARGCSLVQDLSGWRTSSRWPRRACLGPHQWHAALGALSEPWQQSWLFVRVGTGCALTGCKRDRPILASKLPHIPISGWGLAVQGLSLCACAPCCNWHTSALRAIGSLTAGLNCSVFGPRTVCRSGLVCSEGYRVGVFLQRCRRLRS
jgi:hypothetical protein